MTSKPQTDSAATVSAHDIAPIIPAADGPKMSPELAAVLAAHHSFVATAGDGSGADPQTLLQQIDALQSKLEVYEGALKRAAGVSREDDFDISTLAERLLRMSTIAATLVETIIKIDAQIGAPLRVLMQRHLGIGK